MSECTMAVPFLRYGHTVTIENGKQTRSTVITNIQNLWLSSSLLLSVLLTEDFRKVLQYIATSKV